MSSDATASPKKSVIRAPMTYTLVAVQKNESGDIVGYQPVAQPKIEKETPRRDDYRKAVAAALKAGDEQAIKNWNGKQLTVVAHPEPFCFNAKVEVVEVRKVVLDES